MRPAANPSPISASSQAPAKGGNPRPVLLETHINGQGGYGTAVLMTLAADPNTNLYASADEFKHWGIALPDVAPREYASKQYFPLRKVSGLEYHVDNATGTLWITVPATAFSGTATVGGLGKKNPTPQHTPPGGFLNYNFFASRAGDQTTLNAAFEAAVFNNWGVGTSNFLVQNIGQSGHNFLRLDSVWTHDNPDSMTTLALGDSVTNGGMIGGAALMGGVQFRTNFATRPYFLTFPLPALGGETATPSTLQVYMNGQLQKTEQIPPGHFSIPSVPVVTGPGQIQLVVRDAFGREQVITTSFYASSELLKEGLNDYSVSFGKLRENYGSASDDYGAFVANGLFRHGFTDHFTGGIQADASQALQNLGISGSWASVPTGVVHAGVALSHSRLGAGTLGMIEWSRQWTRVSFGFGLRLASPDFTQLGLNGQPASRRVFTANVGAFLGRAGSLSLNYADQDNRDLGRTRLIGAGYNVSIGRRGFLTVNLYRTLGDTGGSGLSLGFNIAFGERSSASVGVNRQNGQTRAYAQVQRGLPAGTGFGYRAGTEFGPDAVSQGSLAYQNDFGTWQLGAIHSPGNTSYQAQATGGIALVDDSVFFSRQLTDSFAVVEVPDLAGVTVYLSNQPVATTGRNGYTLVPRLLAYQNNALSISAENLPLSVQIGAAQINAVPRNRSAVLVKFPVSSARGATFTLMRPDGRPVPAGATVHILGRKRTFPIGYNGSAYVTGLGPHNVLEADWNDQHCRFTVNLPKSKDPVPDLGSFVCKASP